MCPPRTHKQGYRLFGTRAFADVIEVDLELLPSCAKVGPKSYGKRPCRGRTGKDTQMKRGVPMEAGIGGTPLQAKGHQGMPGDGTASLSGPPEGAHPANASISDSGPQSRVRLCSCRTRHCFVLLPPGGPDARDRRGKARVCASDLVPPRGGVPSRTL